MFKVAIVDCHTSDSALLQQLLEQYAEREGQPLLIDRYPGGNAFLMEFRPYYDIAFIDMDDSMEGFGAAKEAHAQDRELCIIFTASRAQYAIRGYEVDALDYILRPVTYPVIADKMDKALRLLRSRHKSEVVLTRETGALRLSIDDIYYIEVLSHDLIYYTPYGSYKVRGKMRDVEQQMQPYGFSRCNNGYLVHLLHVRRIENDMVQVAETWLPVSRGRKKRFLEDFLSYLGGRNV